MVNGKRKSLLEKNENMSIVSLEKEGLKGVVQSSQVIFSNPNVYLQLDGVKTFDISNFNYNPT